MSKQSPGKMSFKELKRELDELSTKLDDELDVDVALELYERGSELVTELNARIDEAEQKIKKVKTSK